jgi:hypothetical protein
MFPGLHARNAQGAKSDDPGTQERCRMQIVEALVQRMRKIRARDDGLGIAAIDVVPREYRRVAQIFTPCTAKAARAVRPAEPRYPDARSNLKRNAVGTSSDDADDLMSGNDRRMMRGKVAFYDVQVGSAHAAGANGDENFTGMQSARVALL